MRTQPKKPNSSNATQQRQRAGRRPNVDWRPRYLAALAESGVYGRAAVAAHIDRVQVWRERKSNPDFATREAEAVAIANMALEDEATRRAIEGTRRYVFYQGKPVLHPETGKPYYEHEYSDALLVQLLKGRVPERYRERLETTGTLRVDITPEEVRERVAEIGRRLSGKLHETQ